MGTESAQEERERQDREKAEDIRKRQIRLGHVPAPEEEPAPKAKASRKKSETSE